MHVQPTSPSYPSYPPPFLPIISASQPCGLVSSTYATEMNALTIPPAVLPIYNPLQAAQFHFIGSDSQSSLRAMQSLKHPRFGKIDPSSVLAGYSHQAETSHSNFYFQWIPAHVGLPGNEEADALADDQRCQTSHLIQSNIEISPSSLKTFIKQHETSQFHNLFLDPLHTHFGARYGVVGLKRSNLQQRRSLPRALQCLYSRWRIGQVDSCGKYPRHMGYVSSDLPCRFCLSPNESPVHLLSLCPGTLSYRFRHGLSLETLCSDSPEDIVLIAKFDYWISTTLPFVICPPMVTLLNESIARHLDESTPAQATASLNPANTNAISRLARKRPLLIPSSWSYAPSPPTRPKQV
jgi:hypothetical protein